MILMILIFKFIGFTIRLTFELTILILKICLFPFSLLFGSGKKYG